MGRQLHTRRLLLTGPKRFSIKVDPTPNPTLRVPSSLTKDWSLGAESNDADERYSPNWLIQLAIDVMGGIDLDPCADPDRRDRGMSSPEPPVQIAASGLADRRLGGISEYR